MWSGKCGQFENGLITFFFTFAVNVFILVIDRFPIKQKLAKLTDHTRPQYICMTPCTLELAPSPNKARFNCLNLFFFSQGIGLMVGLCYSNLHYDQLGVQNLQGLMFLLVTENTFPAMYGVLSLFPQVGLPAPRGPHFRRDR